VIGREAQMPRHPGAQTLALFAGGDLPLITRLRVNRHVAHCGDCEQQVLLFRLAKVELQREAGTQTLTGFEAITHLPELEREMLGNIAVGVDAARCIEKVGRKRSLTLRLSFVAGLLALFAAGWVTHIPREQTLRVTETVRNWAGWGRAAQQGTILRSTPGGIVVRTQGATLTILHPPSAVISMSGSSAVAARYIDEDSGQITITNVYGQ
jgi:hypothetical protein